MFSSRPAQAALVAILAALALPSGAQQVYRIVGPDGRVTFSDRPPPEQQQQGPGKATPAPTVTLPPGQTAAGNASLPFEVRSAAGRYPVTLYTRSGCAPCDQGRAFLSARGIPYAEKTVQSQEDIEAFQRLSPPPLTLPFVTIGGQQLKGFSSAEWGQFLDAAGYPKASQLPIGYRQPAATPLVAAAAAQVPQVPAGSGGAQAPDAPLPAPPAPSSGSNPNNPAGIQF